MERMNQSENEHISDEMATEVSMVLASSFNEIMTEIDEIIKKKPNEETLEAFEAFRQSEAGKALVEYKSISDMFNMLWVSGIEKTPT